jgi:sugar-specific transcriptional regulator TrmB
MDGVDLELLKEAGLTEYESKAYTCLTRYGVLDGPEISEKTGIPRTRVYDTLSSLKEEGLISKVGENPKKYSAVDPERGLKALFDRKIESLSFHRDRVLQQIKDVEGERELEEELESQLDIFKGQEKFFDQFEVWVDAALEEVKVMGVGKAEVPKKVEIKLRELIAKGLDVKFVTTVCSSNEDFLEEFREETGVKLRFYKSGPKFSFGVVDGESAYLNFLGKGSGSERLTIFIRNEEIAEGFSEYFDSIWNKALSIEEAEPSP